MIHREAKPKTIKYRESNQEWYQANKPRISVKNKKHYDENKSEINARNREYYYKNKKHLNNKFIETYREHRKLFLEMYGGKCVCCGESKEPFLAIEHVGGQRNRPKGVRRESSANAYRNAIKMLDKSRYTILCHNCNFATRYGDPCPHQTNPTLTHL